MVMAGEWIGRRGVLGGAGLLAAGAASPVWAAPGKPRVAIKTTKGTMIVEVELQRAPITAANFLHYVDAAKYDGGAFFRAARTPGAPTEGTIVGRLAPRERPFPPIAHESTQKTGLRHRNGTISLGRFSPGSATSDFFICVGDQPYLDAQPGAPGDNLGYAAFGQVVQGMSAASRILASPANGKSPFPDQKGQWLSPTITILGMKRLG
jgi:peptidyl-prolyl cis-trans isomerase A (cyclophilin A)